MRELEVMRIGDVRTMFDYLYWARDRVVAAAGKLSDDAFLSSESVTSRDLRATLVHELDVEWSWRERLYPTPGVESDEAAELQPHDYPTLQALAVHWERDEAEMRSWLSNLTDDDLSSPVSVERAGGPPLWVYLIHVMEHGLTELSDAAVLLNRAGQPVGSITFLDFWDTKKQ